MYSTLNAVHFSLLDDPPMHRLYEYETPLWESTAGGESGENRK